jgi:hypothetical protein
MEFSDINWPAIGIATLANILLAYLFFESPFATSWKKAVGEPDPAWTARKRYGTYFTYSLLLSAMLWFVANVAFLLDIFSIALGGLIFLGSALASEAIRIFLGSDQSLMPKSRIFGLFWAAGVFVSLSIGYFFSF